MSNGKWNKHSKLVAIWAGLNVLYMASGVLCLVFVFAWRGLGPVSAADDYRLLRRFAISEMDALVAITLGGLVAISTIWSLLAYFCARRANATTRPFTLFNVSLVAMITVTLLAGSYIWFSSLREIEEYARIFKGLDPTVQGFIQERLQCCGYYNTTSAGIFSSVTGYCASATINGSTVPSCVAQLVAYSDSTLNSVFTTVYGIVAVQCLLFLATASLRVDKVEQERFERIQEKRGHKGGLV